MSSTFDAYSGSYGEVVQRSIGFSGLKHDLFLQAKARLLSEMFAAHFGPERPSLLDVGCGVGALHGHLRPIVRTLAGCDPSGDSISGARTRHPDLDYRPQPDDALPWSDDTFDATLAVCVFHHVPPAERERLLGQMIRVTRPGGLAVVIEHNPWNPLTRLAVARCPFDADAELLDAREGRALLRRVGLRDVRSRHFLAIPSAAGWAGALERPLRHVPLGAQYAVAGVV